MGLFDLSAKIWAEARRVCPFDQHLALSGIHVAAARGDVIDACGILDDMQRESVDIGIQHITSTIRACWEADGKRHNAAKQLWQVMMQLDLEPDIAAFTCFLGALKTAGLDDVLAAYSEMQQCGVAANSPFAETLCFRNRRPQSGRSTSCSPRSCLRGLSRARLRLGLPLSHGGI